MSALENAPQTLRENGYGQLIIKTLRDPFKPRSELKATRSDVTELVEDWEWGSCGIGLVRHRERAS
jgi:hypothetical protein